MKQCKKCKEWKELNLDNFCKEKRNKDGLSGKCKECIKIYKSDYYFSNKERIDNKNKEYRKNHKEELKEYHRKNHQKNVMRNNQRTKKWRKENKVLNRQIKKSWYNSPMSINSKSKLRKEIEIYEEVIKSLNDNVMCKCAYCGEWFEPVKGQIDNRLKSINGISGGENRLYCSNNCKQNCPIYRKILYPNSQLISTSREVQPELRQMVFARDNYTCQKCNKHRDELEVGIHCHHKEGIRWEPIESADIDMCITLCEDCHKEVHQIEGCGYYDMRCAG